MISNETTKTVMVIDCEVYSRVCGYFRPVSGYNPGKKAEFNERKFTKFPNNFNKLEKK
jgi:anaerobic ribonucleoside-triphosphate reductase